MARQKSLLKFGGEMGGISFYKTQDGYLAREKSEVNGTRISKDASFARTRENNAEFARGGKASKLIRLAFRELIIKSADNRLSNRLTSETIKVVKSDTESLRGERTMSNGDLSLLVGFNFNSNAYLANTLFVDHTAEINRATGAFTITIPQFITGSMIKPPEGATHFRFAAGGAEVDFDAGTRLSKVSYSEAIAIGEQTPGEARLQNMLTPNSSNDLLLVFGIEFFQWVNGQLYSLKNGNYNALAIVAVDGDAS